MKISPVALAEMLDILRNKGVARYETPELTLELYPYQPENASSYDLPPEQDGAGYDIMEDPGLYADGNVPDFSMKMKK